MKSLRTSTILVAILLSFATVFPFLPEADGSSPFSGVSWISLVSGWILRALPLFAVLIAGLLAWDHSPAARRAVTNTVGWLAVRPGRAILVVSLAAVIASAYPVVFLGKSYVSPNMSTDLLYDGFPTLPGYTSSWVEYPKGTDTGALMWGHIPYATTFRRSLAQGELPVWNRYDFGGLPLLGQGYTMFGDPLHFLPIAANSASWAWDLKILVAKWLLAIGLGLLVLSVVRHLPSALLVCLAAPFLGFFIYRYSHPALFSFCYAPWPLLCWIKAAETRRLRSFAAWCAGLILANFALLNSGSVKEAYMLILTLNFSGLCVLASSSAPRKERLLKLGGLVWAGVLFALLASPVWMTFLDALGHARTGYDHPGAFQISPALILGAFDEALYRPLDTNSLVFNPAANFLILGGLLYFLATLRTHFTNRAAAALAASSLVPLGLAFGLIPPQWIVEVPFLSHVVHIDNSFSCPLIILCCVLAGAGFSAAAARLGTRDGRGDLVVAGLLLFAMVFSYTAYCHVVHRPQYGWDATYSPLKEGQTVPVAPFVWAYLAVLLAALAAFGLLARRVLMAGRSTPAAGLALGLCVLALLWRHALQPESAGFWDYVIRPKDRVDFLAPSPAVAYVQAAVKDAPFRATGLDSNFFNGWQAVYGLEGIAGPDPLVNPRFRSLTDLSALQEVWDWRLYVTRDNLAAARPFLDFLNVRYYFARSDGPEMDRVLKNDLRADLDVYESPTAWPRAFFTDRLTTIETPTQLVDRILHGDGRPFAAMQTADLASSPRLARLVGDPSNRSVVQAEGYHLTENTTSFDVEAPRPGLVVLDEALWPGYSHATVDGVKASVIRINHTFQGLEIDRAGMHHVMFSYRPRHFVLTLELFAAGLFGLVASLGLAWRLGPQSRSS